MAQLYNLTYLGGMVSFAKFCYILIRRLPCKHKPHLIAIKNTYNASEGKEKIAHEHNIIF